MSSACKKLTLVGLVGLIALTFLPRATWAQSTIAGLVTDATGGILPGVTVEAESPALIERVRTAVSDGQGRYSIPEVRPGIYSVTFTLPGFTVVRREDILVASNVSVPVNAEMTVGNIEETITVTGASPVVDVQRSARTEVLNRAVLDSLPISRNYGAAGAIMAGVKLSKPDMGGINAMEGLNISHHGKTSNLAVDGEDAQALGGAPYTNFGMVAEVVIQTSGADADVIGGGVRTNMIPRDGGNQFSGEVLYNGSRNAWTSNNLTPELEAAGLPSPTALDSMYDINPALGGPLVQDKFWFYGSFRRLVLNTLPAGSFFAPGTGPAGCQDPCPGVEDQWINSASLRLTYQLTPSNKISAYYDRSFKWKGHDFTAVLPGELSKSGIDPATSPSARDPRLYITSNVKYVSTVSNRLLLEASGSYNPSYWSIVSQPGTQQEPGTPEWLAGAPRLDFIRGTINTGPFFFPQAQRNPNFGYSAQVTYVTGSHTAKVGVFQRVSPRRSQVPEWNGGLTQRYRDGVPDAVDTYPLSSDSQAQADEFAFFAQDSWTMDRLTINPGVRFQYVRGYVQAPGAPGGRFVPAQGPLERFSPLSGAGDWAPRFSLAYDLFGDAKTALKFNASKYVDTRSASTMWRYNPRPSNVARSSRDRRNWDDCDYTPGTSTCSALLLSTNGDDIAQDNEIGPRNIQNFGFGVNRRPADDLGIPYDWDYTIGVQHEVIPNVSVTANWYIIKFYDIQTSRQNVLVDVSDYTPFLVDDPRGNGESITVFNLSREAQSRGVDNVDSTSETNRRSYSGFEVSTNARLPGGGTLAGGWTAERTQVTDCDTNNPNNYRFCDETGELFQEFGEVPGLPYRHEFKAAANYPLPGDVSVGVVLISYAGKPLARNWSVPSSLFPGGRVQSVRLPLDPAGENFYKRWNEVDLRVAKMFNLPSGIRVQGVFEVFNLNNSSAVIRENTSFGSRLGTPGEILQGRLMKLGAILQF